MASCNIAQDLAAATSVASTWCAQWSQTAAPALVTPYTNIPITTLQTPSTTTNSQGQSGLTPTPAGSGGGNSSSKNPALSGGAIAGYVVGGIISAIFAALIGRCIKKIWDAMC
ncbi:hypothetical protein PILCRDRAFT_741445 [Piloderma croceum F 1598]|nr:hypothetical protein PILCRDRAFT_741445 [Piloderma croceum F 1598]